MRNKLMTSAWAVLLALLPACTIDHVGLHCEKLLDKLLIASARCDEALDAKCCGKTYIDGAVEYTGPGCNPCDVFEDLRKQFSRQCGTNR